MLMILEILLMHYYHVHYVSVLHGGVHHGGVHHVGVHSFSEFLQVFRDMIKTLPKSVMEIFEGNS